MNHSEDAKIYLYSFVALATEAEKFATAGLLAGMKHELKRDAKAYLQASQKLLKTVSQFIDLEEFQEDSELFSKVFELIRKAPKDQKDIPVKLLLAWAAGEVKIETNPQQDEKDPQKTDTGSPETGSRLP